MVDVGDTSLSIHAKQILRSLPVDGRAVGNISLRRKLGRSTEQYTNAVRELIGGGFIVRTKGRGGGLRRRQIGDDAQASTLEHAVSGIWRRSSREVRDEFKQRTSTKEEPGRGEELENKLWYLLYKLNPDYITTGRRPRILLEVDLASLDVIACFDRTAVLVECKSSDDESFLLEGLENLRVNRNAFSAWAREFGSFDHVVAVLALKSRKDSSSIVPRRARELQIKLLDEKRANYLLALERESGLGLTPFFWARVFPAQITTERVEVPAVEIKLGGSNTVYAFSVNAHDLLFRAFVSHREIHEEDNAGYQRMIKRSRLNKIKKYIVQFKRFPTPIVVAFERNSGADFKPAAKAEFPGLGKLVLPGKLGSIQVIDGQHRLFGYTKVERSEDHVIHVLAYKDANKIDPAKMFVEINSEQKPVKPDLLWELYPYTRSADHPRRYQVLITGAVEALLQKELSGLVSHIGSGFKGPITFQTICKEVDRTQLIARDNRLAKLWRVGNIVDIPSCSDLDYLRTGFAHSETVIPEKKKQQWVLIMKELTGRSELVDRTELFHDDYYRAAVNLLTKI